MLNENRYAAVLSKHFRQIGLNNFESKHWAPIRDFSQTVEAIADEFLVEWRGNVGAALAAGV